MLNFYVLNWRSKITRFWDEISVLSRSAATAIRSRVQYPRLNSAHKRDFWGSELLSVMEKSGFFGYQRDPYFYGGWAKSKNVAWSTFWFYTRSVSQIELWMRTRWAPDFLQNYFWTLNISKDTSLRSLWIGEICEFEWFVERDVDKSI